MLKINKISDSNYEVLVKSNNKLIGNFYLEVDGFFYFAENEHNGSNGLWSDYALLEIGNKLKELNKPWVEKLEELSSMFEDTDSLEDLPVMDEFQIEPRVSDDFQIGPDGAYEHTDEKNHPES